MGATNWSQGVFICGNLDYDNCNLFVSVFHLKIFIMSLELIDIGKIINREKVWKAAQPFWLEK